MDDKKLAEQIKLIREAGSENKNVDMATLMMHTLAQQDKQPIVSPKTKRWLYLVSLGVPPVGLLLAGVYFFRDEEDAKTVAVICAVLTILALLMLQIFYSSFVKSTGAPTQQLQQIKPQDVQQLYQ